ncbi:MAG: hypothetical protein IPI73_17680 [Betaproteobacteria bacterium]|nr:hypothetical protein [Betaproteobacteria bacterium]
MSTPTFPAKTVAELIPLLKSKPGQFSYASPGVGNIGHLSAELFQQLAGVKLLHVPYQGGGKLVADVMSGEVPLSFISVSPILPLVRAGKLNLLAVTTPSRAVFAPNAPTVAESLPGFARVPISSHSSPPPKATHEYQTIAESTRHSALPGKRIDRVVADPARRRLPGPPNLDGHRLCSRQRNRRDRPRHRATTRSRAETVCCRGQQGRRRRHHRGCQRSG